MLQLFRAVRESRTRRAILQDIFVTRAQAKEYQHLTGSLEVLYEALIEDIYTEKWSQRQEGTFERLQALIYCICQFSPSRAHNLVS
jgi:hypothetical protein